MTSTKAKSAASGAASQLPVDRLKHEVQGLGRAVTRRGFSMASQRVDALTDRLNRLAETGSLRNADPTGGTDTEEKASGNKRTASLKAAGAKAATKVKDTVGSSVQHGVTDSVRDTVKKVVTFAGGGDGGDDGKEPKVTNIIESIDVPVSRETAYQQWTRFEEFPHFTKKVEDVTQDEDEKVTWKARIMWSHRTWEATIVDQVPHERIVWESKGEKGHVDGAVTFHELAPDLTRILVVLEYHPQGLFEHAGNLWRAQGRRVRADLKHFQRHLATHTLLHQDEVDGWEGEIHGAEITDESSAEDESPETEERSSGAEDDRGRSSQAGKDPAKRASSKRKPKPKE